MQLNQNGDITIPKRLDVGENAYITTLQVNQDAYFVGSVFLNGVNINTLYQPRAWISCYVSTSPTISTISHNRGRHNASVTRNSTGTVTVSWAQEHPNGFEYIVHYNLSIDAGFIWHGNYSNKSIRINTRTSLGSDQFLPFYLTIF